MSQPVLFHRGTFIKEDSCSKFAIYFPARRTAMLLQWGRDSKGQSHRQSTHTNPSGHKAILSSVKSMLFSFGKFPYLCGWAIYFQEYEIRIFCFYETCSHCSWSIMQLSWERGKTLVYKYVQKQRLPEECDFE